MWEDQAQRQGLDWLRKRDYNEVLSICSLGLVPRGEQSPTEGENVGNLVTRGYKENGENNDHRFCIRHMGGLYTRTLDVL
jgi:hypothetical protein